VSSERLAHLAQLGFNRLSFGVQGLRPRRAAGRAPHPERESVAALMESARSLGFESTNVDLIYGLPRQTPSRCSAPCAGGGTAPERFALYSYARPPSALKPQRRIDAAALPAAADKVKMLSNAIAGFVGHGYQYIGMDHFALPGMSLAAAKRQGPAAPQLPGLQHAPDCDLIGSGRVVRSDGSAPPTAERQDAARYYDAIRQGQFPVVRGLALTREICCAAP